MLVRFSLSGAALLLCADAFVIPAVLDSQKPLAGNALSDLAAKVHALSDQLALRPTTKSSLDTWLDKEEDIAVDRLLANIAPSGRNAQHAAPGTVLASPSKEHPNYYYQWVRDAGITMATVVDLYLADPSSELSRTVLLPTLESYASISQKIQQTPNPSGDFSFPDLNGLGEPKFEADGSAFTSNWGRPQRDGPALRSIALMKFMRAYNESNPGLWESRTTSTNDWFTKLYSPDLPARSIIKADLEYVARHWPESGFDVWEEVQGRHFFTAMAQLRALREGAELAALFNDAGAAAYYRDQAAKLEAMIASDFWDKRGGYLRATRGGDAEFQRSGMDCSVLLGSIHGNALEPASPDAPLFPPHDDKVLVSLMKLVQDQRDRFPINAQPESPEAGDDSSFAESDPLRPAGVGRYPEDAYDGYASPHPGAGNPWFLCTASVAEILFRTSAHVNATGVVTVSESGWDFWRGLVCPSSSSSSDKDCALSWERKRYTAGDGTGVVEKAQLRLKAIGDGFLAVVKRHAKGDGALSEQFDRWTGFERGAEDLTWSYGAFLQAVWARQRL
ncbi:Glycoside hydrolase family 15 [Macrophomina phaseolina MS6]|uniref:glucan 1,4-alpha-glucosidase n=1 Tax=Macrophomina phaseolina (strain MS6) TaxID=1126212 RepID=K2REN2_MACPH|nr:Glycoside hydrolase family 15 [Macrophomina phaseolina MS6]